MAVVIDAFGLDADHDDAILIEAGDVETAVVPTGVAVRGASRSSIAESGGRIRGRPR
jgi:polysaccharide deacetylase 2 family uncharacterized protein YibQ